jgi:glutamine cyclotransferase
MTRAREGGRIATMRHLPTGFASLAAMTTLAVCGGGAAPMPTVEQRATTPPTFSYRVVRSYPHDPQAYTQGLLYRDGALYEGTGLNGESSLRKVRLETGEVLQIRRLDPKYFGEGIAAVGNDLIQLTWQSEIGFVHDLATFETRRTFSYTGEGWGLTYDGKRLIMSDGSPVLRFLDPRTMRETGRLTVRDSGIPVAQLNELEVVKGEIYANVYQSDRIARISPKSGHVTGWIDLTGLLSRRDATGLDPMDAVLNGIAYDAASDRLFVTGKRWPKLFEISVIKR